MQKIGKRFSRKRKLILKDQIFYTLNYRGKTTKKNYMILYKNIILKLLIHQLLKQREKLNEDIFKKLYTTELLVLI